MERQAYSILREICMLILTRKVGENLLIGDNISITVLSVRGNQVKIGVDAPKDVSVHREEIYHRIKEAEDELKKIARLEQSGGVYV